MTFLRRNGSRDSGRPHDLGTPWLLTGGEAVVIAPDGDGYRALVGPTAGLSARPVRGLDPASGLVQIAGECPRRTDAGRVDWMGLVATGSSPWPTN